MKKETKWISEEMAIELGYLNRFDFEEYAIARGKHSVDEKLRLIRIS